MVQAENIDSRCSSFQLDDRSRRDHHSLAHLSKLPLSETRTATSVGIVVDVSTVLSAGGSLAVRAPGFVSRIGHAVATAGQLTSPLNAVTPAITTGTSR